MNPYYQDEAVTLYCGDCRDMLPTIIADFLITDPPYGIGLQEHGRHGYDWTMAGDDTPTSGQTVLDWAATHRIGTIAFASPKHPWAGRWRQYLVWDKGPAVGGGGDPATCWKQTWELIQVARTPKLNGRRESAVLSFWVGPRNYHHHPAAKPVPLMAYLIGKASQPHHRICDPFAGSGTTLVAAKQLGRKALGIELEERYCAIAAERLAATKRGG